MAKTYTVTVTLTSDATLGKTIAALAKLGVEWQLGDSPATKAVTKAVEEKREYNIPVGTLEERVMASEVLDAIGRGEGMIKRVIDATGCDDYKAISAFITAERIARRDNKPVMADTKSEPNVRKGLDALLART